MLTTSHCVSVLKKDEDTQSGSQCVCVCARVPVISSQEWFTDSVLAVIVKIIPLYRLTVNNICKQCFTAITWLDSNLLLAHSFHDLKNIAAIFPPIPKSFLGFFFFLHERRLFFPSQVFSWNTKCYLINHLCAVNSLKWWITRAFTSSGESVECLRARSQIGVTLWS